MNQYKLLKILENKFNEIKHVPMTYLIKGSWGIGKTYLWNELTETNKNKDLKFVRISLFGIESIEILEQKLKVEYLKNNSKLKEGFQQTLKTLNKKFAAGQIDIMPFITFTDKFIICFDDIERKSEKLNIKDLMGYIENISLKSTVIILMNENKLENDLNYNSYLDYKEKIIDYEFELTEVSHEMCEKILAYSTLDKMYKKEIIRVFQLHKQTNYRVLIKIERFIQSLIFELKTITTDLVSLSSSVVIEQMYIKDNINNDIYKQNDIRVSLFIYREKIKEFLITNHIDTKEFDRIIYPEKYIDFKTNTISKTLAGYIEEMNYIYLKNEEHFLNLFQKIIHFLKENNEVKFDIVMVIDLWRSTRKYQKIYNNLLNQKINLNNLFYEIIFNIIKQMEISELDYIYDDLVLRFPLYEEKFISEEIVNTLLPKVEGIRKEKNFNTITLALVKKNYNEVIKTIKSNPDLILAKLDIYDLITDDNISFEQYEFLMNLTSQIHDTKIKGYIIDYLNNLEESTNDVIIKERFQYFK